MRGTAGGHDLLVATTHLESPLGNHDMRSSERKSQLKQVQAGTASSFPLSGDLRCQDCSYQMLPDSGQMLPDSGMRALAWIQSCRVAAG